MRCVKFVTSLLVTGILKKSINTSDGKWLTLNESEAEGGRRRWKNWKRSIRCHHNTLEKLIKVLIPLTLMSYFIFVMLKEFQI